jgi:hypothetical protein
VPQRLSSSLYAILYSGVVLLAVLVVLAVVVVVVVVGRQSLQVVASDCSLNASTCWELYTAVVVAAVAAIAVYEQCVGEY